MLVESFRNPRTSRVRPERLALIRSRKEPLRFTAASDCIHACLYDFQRPEHPKDPETWIRGSRMLGQISAVSKWLKSRGADLILVPIPRVVELSPDAFLQTPPPPAGVIAPHLRYMIAELLRADVEVFDLFAALRQSPGAANVPFYLPTDAHWTDAAQRLTAKLVGQLLARYPFGEAARKAAPLYRQRPAQFRYGGYYYEYLTPPEVASTRASMTQSISEVVLTNGGAFSAGAQAPLMVVGDSFTAFAYVAIGREQSGEAVALRKVGDPFAEFKPPAGGGIVPYLGQELNVPVSHRAVPGGDTGTLPRFIPGT